MTTTALQTKPTAAVTKRASVLSSMAARYNVNSEKLLDTLKHTAFKGATNEQLMALCIVADQYRLNPFTKEIYAFPDKKTGGIVPVVGIDGWFRIINDHESFDGMDVVMSADGSDCTVTIYRKDREHPITITEYLDECIRDVAPWKSHPRRMLRHKAIIQCARAAFGFAVKDPDEAERILEAEYKDAEPLPPRPLRREKAPAEPVTEPEPVDAGQADGDDLPYANDGAEGGAK